MTTTSRKRAGNEDSSTTTATALSVKHDEEERDAVRLTETNLKGDWANLFLLILLYTMQGLPLGLSSCIPIFLQTYKTLSFHDQAIFSLSGWPFSLKLLWAPLVDAIFIEKLGRRKSWLVPVQYAIGLILTYLAAEIDEVLPKTGVPNVNLLVSIFFALNFLAATQDIAVDGWALTMLKKNNVGYASICNTVGQTLGSVIGLVIPVLFTSEDFCNKYFQSAPGTGGVITMKFILYSCGIMFLSVTTLIAVFKKEKRSQSDSSGNGGGDNDNDDDDDIKLSIVENYVLLKDILKLESVRILGLAMLTAKIGFAATDGVSALIIISDGMPKDNIVVINTAMHVVNMIVSIFIAKKVSGRKPMSVFLNMMPIRLFWNVLFVGLIYYTPEITKVNGVVEVPTYYYAILIFILTVHQIQVYIMFVAIMAFFSRISDSRFGGTYMTLLNTVANLGYSWSVTAALGMIDWLTFKKCSSDSTNNCSTSDLRNTCTTNGGDCVTIVNGYFLEMALCTVIGIVWYLVFKNVLKDLQIKGPSHWMVNVKKPIAKKDKTSYSMAVI